MQQYTIRTNDSLALVESVSHPHIMYHVSDKNGRNREDVLGVNHDLLQAAMSSVVNGFPHSSSNSAHCDLIQGVISSSTIHMAFDIVDWPVKPVKQAISIKTCIYPLIHHCSNFNSFFSLNNFYSAGLYRRLCIAFK